MKAVRNLVIVLITVVVLMFGYVINTKSNQPTERTSIKVVEDSPQPAFFGANPVGVVLNEASVVKGDVNFHPTKLVLEVKKIADESQLMFFCPLSFQVDTANPTGVQFKIRCRNLDGDFVTAEQIFYSHNSGFKNTPNTIPAMGIFYDFRRGKQLKAGTYRIEVDMLVGQSTGTLVPWSSAINTIEFPMAVPNEGVFYTPYNR